ncbi:MAG: calcium-binding protein [Pseudomonadota bacterium]
MELVLLLPWLLGAGLLALIFDNDSGSGSGSGGSGGTNLTSGNDSNLGTNGDDLISGLGGDDSLSGGLGDDVLIGGADSDSLNGGSGNDVLVGDDGTGVVNPTDGRDVMQGGTGDDILIGDNGQDGLFGQDGNDIMFGGFGADNVFGANGDDLAVGHRGEDTVRGGLGNDIVSGNMLYQGLMTAAEAQTLQNDGLANDPSNITRLGALSQRDDLVADRVLGDAGDDDLYIGDADIASGGIGADEFFVSPQSGTNIASEITDFEPGIDEVVVQFAAGAAAPTITLGADGSGNAQVIANGTVVATLNGQAGAVALTDIRVEPV